MKIGILTQPLRSNYGGLLQAYALQKCLSNKGHTVVTINRDFKNKPIGKKIILFLKRVLLRYIRGREDIQIIPLQPTKIEENIIAKNTNNFIKNHLILSDRITTSNKLKEITSQFDAYIIGSDQVWRPKYSPSIGNYFLDFLDNNSNVKRIAYAASFGTDSWEFSKNETKVCAPLLQKFNAVSVREEAGVDLCNKYLGVKATHVVDPTLLLNITDYLSIIEEDQIIVEEKFIMSYVLDTSKEKIEILNKIADQFNLKLIIVEPDTVFSEEKRRNIQNYILPTVGKWLSDFYNAEYVITDSFHGTVFSLIFNKKFIAIGNKKRGISRFTSLLKLVGLETRLVYSLEDVSADKLREDIDYKTVNNVLTKEREKAISFIENALKN